MKIKKLNIGIDASFIHGENTGTGEYTKQLISHLSEFDKKNIYMIFPFFTYIYNEHFKNYHPNLSKNFNIFWLSLPKKIVDFLWNKFYVFRPLYLPRFDIFHSTTFTIPPSTSYKRLIFTVYDVSFFTHPQFHLKENIEHCMIETKEAVKKADVIIAISNHTKNDLIKYFDCPENKIKVTPLACDKIFYKKINEKEKNKVFLKYKIYNAFIFHLGSLEPRKNTMGLIKAYRLLPKNIQDKYNLVIGGGKGWMNSSIHDYIRKYSLSDNIKIVGYINNEELPVFYQAAKCFVYPSFYEGFGIPPLEAMASGCPTLVSNTSSMPEICQNGAEYCEPNNIEDICMKIKGLLSSDNKELIITAKIQSKKFSWSKCIKNTKKIYFEA